jgi:hypothetical protein
MAISTANAKGIRRRRARDASWAAALDDSGNEGVFADPAEAERDPPFVDWSGFLAFPVCSPRRPSRAAGVDAFLPFGPVPLGDDFLFALAARDEPGVPAERASVTRDLLPTSFPFPAADVCIRFEWACARLVNCPRSTKPEPRHHESWPSRPASPRCAGAGCTSPPGRSGLGPRS